MLQSFVALGDSFTEGVGDPRPDGTMRGWADLVAEQLAMASSSGAAGNSARQCDQEQMRAPVSAFHYANLAIRGKLLGQIVDDQLDLALSMAPDLLTFAAGGNDILRPGVDLTGLMRLCDQVVARLVEHDITVVLFTGADPSDHLPMKRVIRSHGDRFCDGIRQIAQRRGAVLVDLWNETALRDLRYWDQDRLHLNSFGHRQVAARLLRELGVQFPLPWLEQPAPLPIPEHPILAQAEYYRGHVLPWVQRRLTGKSSGDDMEAKRPLLTPVAALSEQDNQAS